MNVKSMRDRTYHDIEVDGDVPPAAAERYRTLKRFDLLRAAGCVEREALAQVGISRRTMYRWKRLPADGGPCALAPKSTRPRRVRQRAYTRKDVAAVLKLRRRHSFMGKARLHAMLRRGGFALSASTVGRIIQRALAAGRIGPASLCEGRVRRKRKREFSGAWAQPWKYGSKAGGPGELVQIDHMTYSRDGETIKEFRAVCPVSRFMVTRVHSRATAGNAARFLAEVVEAMPFPVASIQVDGGSEFMAGFEDACKERGIALAVLPPRHPQWNGCVERANRSARIEFWNRYAGSLTVAAVSKKLREYELFHNYLRPHTSLALQTPSEYLVAQEEAA